MLLLISAGLLAVLTLIALIARPALGVALLFLTRPIIDATWSMPMIFGFNPSQLMGVLVPSIVIAHIIVRASGTERFRHMPLKLPWLLFSGYVLVFAASMSFVEGWLDGVEVMFRHLNGIVGFYMIQAFYSRTEDVRRLMLVIAAAGVFPIAVGIYQQLTGVQWEQAQAEGLTRLIGLYHDAFTVRYIMLQTLLALLVWGALHPRLDPLRFSAAVGYAAAALAVLFKAYSKSGVVTLALWAVTWAALRRRAWLFGIGASIGAVAVALVAQDFAAQISQLFIKELTAIAGAGDPMRTFAGRWFSWREMWGAWLAMGPLAQVFGSGHKATGAHNDYLLMLFHGGIVGLALYLALLAAALRRVIANLRRRPRPLDVAAFMVLCLWFVDSIGLVPSAYPGYQWFVWGFIGLALRMRERALPDVETSTAQRGPPIVFHGLAQPRDWQAVSGHGR
jgi:hypothetical protein